ncbi:AfsR/SARP family transcriptional regulator [Streptomyces misionensis]
MTRPPGTTGDDTIRFSVLGPVRVWRGREELLVGPKQQRLVLAVLLARAGRPVSMSEFTDLLWDGDPPASATNAVHRYVGTLRRLLEPGLPARSPGRWLARKAGGYLMHVDAGCLDLLEFRALVERARRCSAAGDPAAAVDLYLAALSLREDRCAADLVSASGGHPAFVMIDHEYVSVVREAAETASRCDRTADMLLPLRQAVEHDPLDEALVAHLLGALSADGKQAEAMTLYLEVRRRLADELGVDPGPELQAAHARLPRRQPVAPSRGEAGKDGGGRTRGDSPPAASVPVVRPAQLPADLAGFTGRDAALRQAAALAESQDGALRVLAVDGIPGIGKTTLAVHFAHRVARDFPDGQLYADLRGFTSEGGPAEPGDVLAGFLGALGVPQHRIPASLEMRSALYRGVLAGRRVLVVLDNAWDTNQVRPLLPGTPECMVVVTSRSRLTGLASAHAAQLLTLDVPSAEEATENFLKRVRGCRPDLDAHQVRPIVERCGRLPLALAVVAARTAAQPERTPAQIQAELADSGRSLDGFSDDNLDNDVRAVFSWSYRTLGPRAARLFRLLPLHPGPDATVTALASLAGTPPGETAADVGELVRARLLTVRQRDRYRAHDLVLGYASELCGLSATERAAALDRLHDHYRGTAQAANLLLRARDRQAEALAPPSDAAYPTPLPDASAALDWFVAERSVLRAVVESAAAHGDVRTAWELAVSMQLFQQRLGWWHDWAATMRCVLQATRSAGDREGETHAHRGLAGARYHLGDPDGALRCLERARQGFERLGLDDDLAQVLHDIGTLRYARGEYDRALRHQERALRLLRAGGRRHRQAVVTVDAGKTRLRLGDTAEAARLAMAAGGIFRELGDLNGEASSLALLADVHRANGEYVRSALCRGQAIALARGTGRPVGEAAEPLEPGDARLDAGDDVGARRARAEALKHGNRAGLPVSVRARRRPGRPGARVHRPASGRDGGADGPEVMEAARP